MITSATSDPDLASSQYLQCMRSRFTQRIPHEMGIRLGGLDKALNSEVPMAFFGLAMNLAARW